jgi:hypothetical protein
MLAGSKRKDYVLPEKSMGCRHICLFHALEAAAVFRAIMEDDVAVFSIQANKFGQQFFQERPRSARWN